MHLRSPQESSETLRELSTTLAVSANNLAILIILIPEIEAKIDLSFCLYNRNRLSSRLLARSTELSAASTEVQVPGSLRVGLESNSIAHIQKLIDENIAEKATVDKIIKATHPLWDQPSWLILKSLRRYLSSERKQLSDLVLSVRKLLGPDGAKLEYVRNSTPGRDKRFGDAAIEYPKRPKDVESFHAVLMTTEIPTIEHCCSLIADFPDMPAELKSDLSRQIWDEARHAKSFYLEIIQRGFSLGGRENFDLWKLTSNQALPLRLCIHQCIGEKRGVEAAAAHAKSIKKTDPLRSILAEFVSSDESQHYLLGEKWLRKLVPDDDDRIAIRKQALAMRKVALGEH